jgi:acetate kinase
VRVLVVNAGSSSMKLRMLGPGDELEAERDLEPGDDAALADAVAQLGTPDAIGHRVVHGGERFREAVRIDEDVVAALRELVDLAPLHQPAALAAIASVGDALPGVPAVACFDTAFHASLPPGAATYALPREWRERFGLRRYGFHGLSHAYAARRAAAPRVVSCHLGAGASLAAIRDGVSVDTTMGFTPMEGLVMATRSGSVDPGLVLWLLRHGLDGAAIEEGLDREGGLRGLAGDADMRAVLGRDDADARLALDVYVHRLRASIAAMAAALDGLDVLVFTGGIGERSPDVRARAAAGLGFLGVHLDPDANARASADAEIGAHGAPVRALVVTAREDLEVARQVRALLTQPEREGGKP